MSQLQARIIMVATPWTLIGWTIGCWWFDLPKEWCSSQLIHRSVHAYPILAWLFGWVSLGIAKTAFPEIDWWRLTELAVATASIGHALWGLK